MTNGNVVSVFGTLSVEEEKAPKIIAEKFFEAPSSSFVKKSAPKKRKGLFVKIKSKNSTKTSEIL
ncbi:hypothetical protein RFX30_08340, partial [Acinetobacter baumannii]|nr:hypothetical protein [Acinetobacter baumannii]